MNPISFESAIREAETRGAEGMRLEAYQALARSLHAAASAGDPTQACSALDQIAALGCPVDISLLVSTLLTGVLGDITPDKQPKYQSLLYYLWACASEPPRIRIAPGCSLADPCYAADAPAVSEEALTAILSKIHAVGVVVPEPARPAPPPMADLSKTNLPAPPAFPPTPAEAYAELVRELRATAAAARAITPKGTQFHLDDASYKKLATLLGGSAQNGGEEPCETRNGKTLKAYNWALADIAACGFAIDAERLFPLVSDAILVDRIHWAHRDTFRALLVYYKRYALGDKTLTSYDHLITRRPERGRDGYHYSPDWKCADLYYDKVSINADRAESVIAAVALCATPLAQSA